MTRITPSMCRACARLRPESWTCDAFPAGIPTDIGIFGDDHRKPFRGDNGIRFLQGTEPDQVEAFQDWQTTFGEQ